jgi:uncharacterized membrane protein
MMSAEPWAEVYKAVRAHELMLNQAASRFEHAFLGPLVVLNGGALVAFLALLGADADLAWERWWAFAAIASWALGLLLAAVAVGAALRQQQHVNIGFRLMRQELEAEFFGPSGIVRITKPPAQTLTRPEAQERARKARNWMLTTRFASVMAFAIGVALAGLSIALAPDDAGKAVIELKISGG